MDSPLARVIALYLPQYYPTPENDEWWGRGFTEWTSTAMAKPLFPGHYQPHVPADLGFYDLRLPESRGAQAQLAREHGVEGFCYYHYWFAGRRILERPFDEVVASGQPDFPFCLNWANQTWTSHGAPNRVLIEQTYPGIDDHRRHFDALLPAFTDQRCLKVDGRPLFVIYRPRDLPESRRVLELWRDLAVKAGLSGLFIAGDQMEPALDIRPLGYDAAVNVRVPVRRRSTRIAWTRPVEKLKFKYDEWRQGLIVQRYEDFIDRMIADRVPELESFPCVIPNWDNSPKRGGNGFVLHGSTPELFRRHLRRALDSVADLPHDRRIIFVKSWNEWAEGNHLEPDLKFGRGYLQVLREELTRRQSEDVLSSSNATVHDVPDRPTAGPRVSTTNARQSLAHER
jgi:lipopolysaccharide biosynthesis protein